MGHPALAAGGAGKPPQHIGDLVFGKVYLFAAVVAEHRLNGLGQAPVIAMMTTVNGWVGYPDLRVSPFAVRV